MPRGTAFFHTTGEKSGLRLAAPLALTLTPYQLGKYCKHTIPASLANFNIVFTSPASRTYHDFLVTTVAFGHLQVDDRGRCNVVWVASRQTGISLQVGQFLGSTDGVKVVLPHDDNRIHAFPIPSSEVLSAVCAACGKALSYADIEIFTGLPTS
jgi:hypothetical protein